MADGALDTDSVADAGAPEPRYQPPTGARASVADPNSKERYRRDIEAQIRANEERKAAERHSRRRADAEDDARVARESASLRQEVEDEIMQQRRREHGHDDFAGIEDGIDREATTALLHARRLTAAQRTFLRTILSGGEWTQARAKQIGHVESDACPHCGTGQPEDQEHSLALLTATRKVNTFFRNKTV